MKSPNQERKDANGKSRDLAFDEESLKRGDCSRNAAVSPTDSSSTGSVKRYYRSIEKRLFNHLITLNYPYLI